MKKPTFTLISFFILTGLLFTPQVYAAWPLAIWEGIKQLTAEVATAMVTDYFKEDTTPERIDQLSQRLDQLTAQLEEVQKQAKNYPSESELNNLIQLANDLKVMYAAMVNRTPLEERIATMEVQIAQIWKRLDSLTHSETKPRFAFKLNYVYQTQGQGEFKPLTDETVLRSGDHYKIIFEPSQNGYAYLFQVDSAKQLYQLFPMQSFESVGVVVNHRNPVKANQQYYLPAKDKSFVLDNQTGQEKLYFTASQQPDVVLENFYKALQNAPKPAKLPLQTQFAKTILEVKGISHVAKDVPGKKISWPQEGQTAQVPQQELTDFCSNCINVLTFEHR